MKFVDIFAGIGGFSLGFERAGMECVGHVEIDPYAQKVLKKHWPDVPLYGDIKDVKGTEFGTVDVICGGFPCQDLSASNQHEAMGIEGKRSSLFGEMLRLASIIKPRWIVFENVTELLRQPNAERFFGEIAKIGYDAEWETIRASQFGLPHHRNRVFVVAYPNGKRFLHSNENEGKFDYKISKERGPGEDMRRFKSPWDKNYLVPEYIRESDGLSEESHADRLKSRVKCLGNSIVPLITEYIGTAIMEADKLITE